MSEGFLGQFEQVEGRDIAALADARPACIIGARSDAGEVCFATVIWATPVSHAPALVAFALRERSHTMGIIRATGRFSLSTPPADARGVQLVKYCGGNTGRLVDKGAAVPHALVELRNGEGGDGSEGEHGAALVPVPLHSYSWLAGKVESIREAGDHLLVVGHVTRAATQAPRDERGLLTPHNTLLCVQHGVYAKAETLGQKDGEAHA